MSGPTPAEASPAATESSTTEAATESPPMSTDAAAAAAAAKEEEAAPAPAPRPAVEAGAAPSQQEDEKKYTAAPEPSKEAKVSPAHAHGRHHHDLQAAAEAARAAKLQSAQRLQEFEAQRIAYFAPQIRSNATHWHAFAVTLRRAQAENERVLDFFAKRLAIEQQYSDKLRALPYEELKGGGGGWRPGGKGSHAAASSSSSSSLHQTRAAASKASAAAKQQQPPQQPQELAALRAHYCERRVALPAMEELVGSMDALVTKYDEYCTDTHKELLEGRLKPLASAYKATSDGILAEGSQALENVQRAEQRVEHAYSDLARAIAALSPAASVPQTGTEAAHREDHGDGGDLWLHDMQYRVMVEQQKRVWATAQAQLGVLFGRMKMLELNRRQQLHALILRFMQNQGGFWGQLPHLASDSALRISGLAPSDPQEVENALAVEIRSGARAAEEKEQEHKAAATGKHKGGTPPSGVGGGGASSSQASSSQPSALAPPSAPPATLSDEPFTGALRSPLDTSLVKRAEVLEHKHTTGMESLPLLKRWRPTLAVLTVDNVLHLFDLPPGAAADNKAPFGLSSKEAFRALVPQPLDSKGRVKKGKEAERIRPTASLALDRSKARFRPEEGDGAFDVTESTASVGIAKVFKSHETRRVTLRAQSQAAMVDWCVIVNGEEHVAS